MYGDAVDDVGAKVFDFWNQVFWTVCFSSPASIQTDDSKVSGISATGAKIAVTGGEASNGEWESGDMCAFVGEGVEAGYIAKGSEVNDVWVWV